jgi:hypothetical protein
LVIYSVNTLAFIRGHPLVVFMDDSVCFASQLNLSLFSQDITACEMLGSGTGISVGSTLRLLLKKPFPDPDDTEDELALDAIVTEVSDVSHRVAWSITVPAGKVRALGGLAWRRDSLQVIRTSAEPECVVLWVCEYKFKQSDGGVDERCLDLGMKAAFSAGLSSKLSPPLPLASVPVPQERVSCVSTEAPVKVLDVGSNSFVDVAPDNIVVGDICSFQSGALFPADLMILASSAPQETAVTYAAIDGCDTLRLRKVAQQLGSSLSGVFASSAATAATVVPAFEGFSSGLCPMCTFENDPVAESCEVCGTCLLPAMGAAASGGSDVLSSLGKGGEFQADVARVIAMLSLCTTPARLDGRSRALLHIEGQTDPVKLGNKQYLPGVCKRFPLVV